MNDQSQPAPYNWHGEILQRVMRGEITPDLAEQMAKESGRPPFARSPAEVHLDLAAQSDPMKESDWTLAMALAWVIWRDINRVREFWNEYRRECPEWKKPQPDFGDIGWRLGRCSNVTARSVLGIASKDNSLDISKLALEFRQKLRSGKITARGELQRGVGYEEIPAAKWIEFRDFNSDRTDADSIVVAESNGPRYFGVRLPMDELLAFWPPADSQSPNCDEARIETHSDHVTRRRGPKTNKRETACAQMMGRLNAGQISLQDLGAQSEESMKAEYGVSRDTARKARKLALSQLRAESNSYK